MIGIRAFTVYLPSTSVAIEDLLAVAGESPALLAPMLAGGLRRVPIASGIEELIGGALEALPPGIAPLACFFAHSLPDDGEAAAALRRRFASTPLLELSGQPCAILHFVIRAASAWLRRNGSAIDEVLVVGADHARAPADRLFFNSAMGDAAVALLLGRQDLKLALLASYVDTDLIACDGARSDADAIRDFRAVNPSAIRTAITECARQAGLTVNDVRFLFPHTPYTSIWDAVASLLRYPRERIVTDSVGRTGHLNSNDAFVHLHEALSGGRLKRGDVVMTVNPGFGGTRGCTLLRVGGGA